LPTVVFPAPATPMITTRAIGAERYANVFDRAPLGYDGAMYIGVVQSSSS